MTIAQPTTTDAPEPPAATAAGAPAVTVHRLSAWWVLIAGIVGLIAAMDLTIEKIILLTDPEYVPSCSINPILSCGSVMSTEQASAFGFPNSLIGVAGFTVVVVSGVLAVARVPLPRWYWSGLAAGVLLGATFVHWLIYQSVYRIEALCPYCMVVWSVTIPLLVVTTSIALRGTSLRGSALVRVVYTWRWSLVALWFTAVFLIILVHFWDYWSTLI